MGTWSTLSLLGWRRTERVYTQTPRFFLSEEREVGVEGGGGWERFYLLGEVKIIVLFVDRLKE
jgi:hypothetical protein